MSLARRSMRHVTWSDPIHNTSKPELKTAKGSRHIQSNGSNATCPQGLEPYGLSRVEQQEQGWPCPSAWIKPNVLISARPKDPGLLVPLVQPETQLSGPPNQTCHVIGSAKQPWQLVSACHVTCQQTCHFCHAEFHVNNIFVQSCLLTGHLSRQQVSWSRHANISPILPRQ